MLHHHGSGISRSCLLETALPEVLEYLTGHIEVMDGDHHHLENADLLLQNSCRYTIHASLRGSNLASLPEPIRRASVDVMVSCFAIAGNVGALVVPHPFFFK